MTLNAEDGDYGNQRNITYDINQSKRTKVLIFYIT